MLPTKVSHTHTVPVYCKETGVYNSLLLLTDAVVAEDQDVALLDQVPNSAVPGATVSQQEANAR